MKDSQLYFLIGAMMMCCSSICMQIENPTSLIFISPFVGTIIFALALVYYARRFERSSR